MIESGIKIQFPSRLRQFIQMGLENGGNSNSELKLTEIGIGEEILLILKRKQSNHWHDSAFEGKLSFWSLSGQLIGHCKVCNRLSYWPIKCARFPVVTSRY